MPELPELEVIKNFFNARILNLPIQLIQIKQPLVFRCLLNELQEKLTQAYFTKIERRGKFLLFHTHQPEILVFNLMLSGRLQWVEKNEKLKPVTCLQMTFENGRELRYFDQRKMGRIYLVTPENLSTIPQWSELGLEPLDETFTYEVFLAGLKQRFGMIKNVLLSQKFLSGIGNAYADEILFEAGILPLRKRTELLPEESLRLFQAIKNVLNVSISMVEKDVVEEIHQEKRAFLRVHNRGGQPCPKCGTTISELKPDGRTTNFCRACQH